MSDESIQQRRQREQYIDSCTLQSPLEVARLFEEYTKVIWNHKMVGRIHDFYDDDCIIHREGGEDVQGLMNVFSGTLNFMAAFPDLKFTFIDIFAEGNPEEGYRFGQALYYEGCNTGLNPYGAPTFKKLTEDVPCLALCECLVKKVNGRWKIVEEWLVRSSAAIDDTLNSGEEYED